MKKIMIPIVALTLGVSSFSSSLYVSAKENDSTERFENISFDNKKVDLIEPDFDYEVFKNEETGINTIKMTYDGEDSVAIYDTNTGEVVFDGELVAIINKNERVEDSEMIQTYSSYKYNFTVGPSDYGSGTYVSKYYDTGTISIIGASAALTSVTATLVALFTEKKPLKTNAQIIAAAATLLTVINSVNTTLDWGYMHTKDKNRTAWYYDTLNLRKGSANTMSIKHYYGYVD